MTSRDAAAVKSCASRRHQPADPSRLSPRADEIDEDRFGLQFPQRVLNAVLQRRSITDIEWRIVVKGMALANSRHHFEDGAT